MLGDPNQQGEVAPDQLWEGRLPPRTPVPGLWRRDSPVIALNDRDAALTALADERRRREAS